MLILIAAVSRNWGIGKDNDLLFNIPEDKKFFRSTTLHHTVIMGRKTLLSLPFGKPFKDRDNVVLSRDESFSPEGVTVVRSVDGAAEYAKKCDGDVFVAGGGQIYKQMLPYCDKALITKVDSSPDADVFFPNLDDDPQWVITDESEEKEYEGLRYKFCTYEKTDK
jgi:dihydrofolate reductase